MIIGRRPQPREAGSNGPDSDVALLHADATAGRRPANL